MTGSIKSVKPTQTKPAPSGVRLGNMYLRPPFEILSGMATMLIVVVFVLTFVVQSYQIPSESMENTLLIGDFLLVDKLVYSPRGHLGTAIPYREPQDGDVIIFHHPVDASVLLVKRVIGVPGDRVHLRDGVVIRNGVALQEPYALHQAGTPDAYRDNFPVGAAGDERVRPAWLSQLSTSTRDGDFVVPPGGLFVMGDNRNASLDSRYWGLVPRQNIIGRPLLIYFSGEGRPTPDDKIAAERKPLSTRLRRIFRVVH